MRLPAFTIVAAMILAAISMGSCTQKASPAMERIDALIAAGDTVTESGMYNIFVIKGATLTPEMMDAGLFTSLEKLSVLGKSDSEYCMAVQHDDNSFIAAKKIYVDMLFPEAKEFVVDGDKATRAEFDRIPASLLLSVTGEDGGQKLVVKTREDVDDPSSDYNALQEAEGKWFDVRRENFLMAFPKSSDIVVNDLSTYPANSRVYVESLLRSRDYANALPEEKSNSLVLMFIDDRPFVYINERYPRMNPKNSDEAVRIPVSELPSLKLSDIAAHVGKPIGMLSLEQDTVYVLIKPGE